MALGEFDVIGNVFPDLIILPPESNYANAGKNFSHTNLDALEIIDSWIPHDGGLGWNWRIYDNWEYDPGTQTFVFNAGNADDYVDMIFMIYRNATYKINPNDPNEDPGEWFGGGWGAFSGAATLGNISFEFQTNDGLIVSSGDGYISQLGSGLTIRNGGPNGKWGTRQISAHEYGHYLFGGGHTNYGGIMGGATNALSGWERIRLGYINPDFANANGYESELRDFIGTGDILKISVPFNNPSSTKYFLVENHQRTSSYDHLVRGGVIQGGLDYTGIGKGIFIYLVTNGQSYPNSVHEILSADGRWDWYLAGEIQMPSGWPPYMPLINKSSVNRNTGKTDRNFKVYYWGHPPEVKNDWWGIWHSIDPMTKEWTLTRNVMGDEKDAYNIGYIENITPWSNPSTYVEGVPNYISIKLLEDDNGVITIKVFSSYPSTLALPPSQPQFLKVSAVNGFAQLNWAANIEPDIISNGKYRIYRYGAEGEEPPVFTTHIAEINAYVGGQPVTQWTDPNPAVGGGRHKLFYAISAVDNTSLVSPLSNFDWVYWDENWQKSVSGFTSQSFEYSLYNNFPNPFNPTTTISYSISKNGLVTLKVYDILGKEVAELVNEAKEAGNYSVTFNASELPSGIYFYTLTSGNFTATKKLILLR